MMDFLSRASSTLLYTLVETAPYVLIGYLIAAIIREFLPRNFLARWLGPQGIAPLFKAIGVGSILPICSCGVVPLGVGLVRCGAAKGTVLSFMASAPAISPVSIILGLSLLGGKFMMIYVAIVLVGAFIIGWIGNRILRTPAQKETPTNKGFQKKESELTPAEKMISFPKRMGRAAHWAMFDLGTEVSLDLLFGLTLATLVSILIPPAWIASWLGGAGILPIILIIVLSLPIYTCSVPSLPVIQKLVFMGASPGVAVAYLIAGPVTNLGELTVIHRAVGRRTVLYYIVGVFLVALLGGMIANAFLLDPDGRTMMSLTAKHLGSQLVGASGFDALWKLIQTEGFLTVASAVIVGVILIVGSFQKIRLLFVNPCKHCMFWNDISQSAACPGPCWLKKTNRAFRRIFGIRD